MSSDSIRLLSKEEGRKVISKANAVRKAEDAYLHEVPLITKEEYIAGEAWVGNL